MAFLEVKNVAIRGISACVPKNVVENAAFYEERWGGYDLFLGTTGIAKHRNSPAGICSSDLCVRAAEVLIDTLGWEKESIDALVFVSQTPDFYNVPATSTVMQERLGCRIQCYTLDIALGCSGWVYGMSVLSSLVQTGTIKRALLCAGDTPTKFCAPTDKSTYPLFGDAGTVTALEYDEEAGSMQYAMYSDGSGYKAININSGGYRNPVTEAAFHLEEHGEGKVRNGLNLEMDGESVFVFGISKAPKAIKALCEQFAIDINAIDLFTFHQANLFMNEKIRNKLKIAPEKVPYSMQEYGNTSCASIPLTMVTRSMEQMKSQKVNHIACGFGVGLSWGAMHFSTDHVVIPPLIEM